MLPDIISKEPLGPSVRKDDIQWFQIVQWAHYAMVTAEELGVTKANVDEKLKSDNPDIRRLLGVEGDFGKGLGLTNDWAYRIIKAVGNYGKSFERNVGTGLADQDPPRSERAVDKGRTAIRAADPVTSRPRPVSTLGAPVSRPSVLAGAALRVGTTAPASRASRTAPLLRPRGTGPAPC